MKPEDLDHRKSNMRITIRQILGKYSIFDNEELVDYVYSILEDNNKMRKKLIQINNLTKGYKV